jgi:hypothetical protein
MPLQQSLDVWTTVVGDDWTQQVPGQLLVTSPFIDEMKRTTCSLF